MYNSKSFVLKPVSVAEVIDLIYSLLPKTAFGIDNLSSNLLKILLKFPSKSSWKYYLKHIWHWSIARFSETFKANFLKKERKKQTPWQL